MLQSGHGCVAPGLRKHAAQCGLSPTATPATLRYFPQEAQVLCVTLLRHVSQIFSRIPAEGMEDSRVDIVPHEAHGAGSRKCGAQEGQTGLPLLYKPALGVGFPQRMQRRFAA